jgi:hypothetical protein
MVNSFTDKCLIFEPGKAPTPPPPVFHGEGTVIVTPTPPRPDPQTEGFRPDKGEVTEIIFQPPPPEEEYVWVCTELKECVLVLKASLGVGQPYWSTQGECRSFCESILGASVSPRGRDSSTTTRNRHYPYEQNFNFNSYVGNNSNGILVNSGYKHTNIFNSKYSLEIKETIKANSRNSSVNTYPFYSFRGRPEKMFSNLSEDLKNSLNKLPSRLRTRYLSSITTSLFDDNLKRVDTNHIHEVTKRYKEKDISKVSYPRSDIRTVYENFQLNKIPLDPESHTNIYRQKELQTWKTIPSDLDKKIEVLLKSGETSEFSIISDDDSFIYTTSSGTDTKLYINDGDTVDIYRESLFKYPITTNIHNAFIMSQEDIIASFNQLKSPNHPEYSIGLTVSSDNSYDIERTYDLDTALNDYFYFTIDNTSFKNHNVTDIGLRSTTVKYDRLSVEGDINDDVKFRAFPSIVLPISNEDPILKHLIRGTVTLTFTDLDLYNLGNEFMPRMIPYHVIFVPTDNAKLSNYNAESTLLSLNSDKTVRYLNFTYNIDKYHVKKGLHHDYLRREYTYPNANIDGIEDTQGIKYTFNFGDRISRLKFKEESESLPRRESSIRLFLNAVSRVVSNYTISDTGLNWFDVLSRVNSRAVLSLLTASTEQTRQDLGKGVLTGVRLGPSIKGTPTKIVSQTGTEFPIKTVLDKSSFY